MRIFRTSLLILSALALMSSQPAVATADPLTLTLNPSIQTGAAGSLVTFQGSFSNDGVPATFVNGVSFTISGSSVGFTFDASDFFLAVPIVVDPGFTVGNTNFFTVLIDLAVGPGSYTGSFSVLGGISETDDNILASREFVIQVSAAVRQIPEPGTLLLLGSSLSVFAALIIRRGSQLRRATDGSTHGLVKTDP